MRGAEVNELKLTGHSHYVKMSGELSCATAVLEDTHTAASEIDRVINAMLLHSKPG